jgi:hypothetical protein
VWPERNFLSVFSFSQEEKMTRLTLICISFIIISSMFAGQSHAKVDPETILGIWLLDEGNGDIAEDNSENGNDGTIIDAPAWIDGVSGSALDFRDSSSHVDCDNAEALNVKVFSVSFWCNVTITPGWNHIISRGSHVAGGTPGSVNWGIMMVNEQETILFETFNDTGWLGIRTGTTADEWHHVVATYDGDTMQLFYDGELADTRSGAGILLDQTRSFVIGARSNDGPASHFYSGSIDEVGYFNTILETEDIETIMNNGLAGIIGDKPLARRPDPADGALYADTSLTLSWRAGDFAVSHDLYLGDNAGEVNEATRDSDVFRGNLIDTSLNAGLPGHPYPDGLVPGKTYYWRIDEVNEAEPNSPWKGDLWSFSIAPRTAYYPDPADGAEFVDLNVQLKCTAGLGAKSHYIIFGEDFDEVFIAIVIPDGPVTYTPGPLKMAKTYYWRVDEFDGTETHKGKVWSFTTEGAVSGPNPSNGDMSVSLPQILTWDAGAVAASHEVYFGTDADAVKNAGKTSPEYKGPKALGDESYDPGKLVFNTTYFWRIDEINDVNPDSPWAGNVWSFTTGDFFVIDDFEDYNAGDNQIWWAWKDGLGYVAHDNEPAYPGNGTGSAVGDETAVSYTEETIVHGGLQSMPIAYDNNKQGYSKYSEVELTLSAVRDWTAEDVAELSLWFRGYPASVGSFVESPAGTYTMTGSGADIWGPSDEFHYAFMTLTGAGTIIAKLESLDSTNGFAKAGVMIRDTLDADSIYAAVLVTPENGVRFQHRNTAGGTTSRQFAEGITAPQWVRLERTSGGLVRAYYSADGTTWERFNLVQVLMDMPVYIGLAATSHDAALTCEAVFTNVTTTGPVDSLWENQDIGIVSNDAEPLYVAVSNSAGAPAVVYHDDPAAVQIDTWTEWAIPLSAFADQGINLSNVDRIAIGLGTQGNLTAPGGSGKMYFDDIRLYRPRRASQE